MREYSAFNRSVIGDYVKMLMVNTDNGIFAVDPEDCVVGYALRKRGGYGQREVSNISNYLNSNSRVLIVGAHISTLVFPISKLVKSVVAIEANPKTFDYLDMNIKFNRLTNCEAFQVAANDKYE